MENCDDDFEVLLYCINGGGHTWPGGWIDPSWTHLGVLNKDIYASAEIWNFFQRNPHPNPWVNIPDTAFLYALIDEGVDTDGDGQISYAEAEAVKSLILNNSVLWGACYGPLKNITSLKGIEAFINLDSLNCACCGISSIDLSLNLSLRELLCSYNQLRNLDVSSNKELESLYCHYNLLDTLDLSENSALKILTCGGNNISSLDLFNNKELEVLYCGDWPRLTVGGAPLCSPN